MERDEVLEDSGWREIHDATCNQMPDTLYWPNVFGERFGVLRAELRYFADCVAHEKRPDRITPIESRNAVALLEGAEKSSQTGAVFTF